MVTASTSLDLARRFAHLFEQAKELAKSAPSDVSNLYEAIASHLRSAAPMSLVQPPALADGPDLLIDLGAGQVIRVRPIDGRLNLHVFETAQHDAAVVLSETARAQLVAALEVVRHG
jgi:hypothetical protein